ncbi:signal transduction histidine kinase [Sphingomonas zeicaulis]|uniref:hybrid sensor histidine kinase/response regulator n=1 Tax=Sphingomonas zeicaulis TaxID=1632740 RepID=UPI003D228213
MASDGPGRREDRADPQLGAILAAAGASGTWDWDLVPDRLHVDERFADLYAFDIDRDGAGPDGLPGSAFYSAIHPDDRARIRIAVAGIRNGADLFSKEFRIVRPDGALIWVHGRGQTQRDALERPIRFTGILIDVTERKRTEERLRIAQSAGGVGTFEYSDGFATATVSDEFCRLLGLHPASVLPISTINGVVLEGPGALIPEADQHGVAPETLDGEFGICRPSDETNRWIARRGEIVRDGEGSGYRLIGVIYDITAAKAQEAALRTLNDTLEARVEEAIAERHEAEEALRQAQKMEAVGHLTGGIAHDFNNLLTIIIGNIDTALRRLDLNEDPRARRSLDNALKGAERAASLTQRLLAFSRRQPLDPKPVDVGRLFAGMTDLLTRSISEAIAIHVSAPADIWTVEADPHQLENAILNLAVNARDAMTGSGSLTILARNQRLGTAPRGADNDFVPGDYVAIAVTDTGTGIPDEIAARVFDPFFTTKDVGKGTGLGLSMVYGYVKQSGGQVIIASTAGEGTTVTLYLPRMHRAADAPTELAGTMIQRSSGTETVLVVEDDDNVRAYTVDVLRELGYRVIEAHDGEAAMRLLDRQDQNVHLLLTDVVMPKMSGAELAEAARHRQPELRVLYTSGYTRDAIMRDGRLAPGVDLLAKPFTFAALAERVRDLLDRR